MINSYVAIDLETTGLNPKEDKIIEVGACRVVDGEIQAEFSALVSPGRLLEARITELTGITDSMLDGCPGIETVLPQVLEFCGELPILGHQVIFDYSFLKRAAVNEGFEFRREGIDTLAICRKLMPVGQGKSLKAACQFFGIVNSNAHRAVSDARAAHELYQVLLTGFGSREPEVFTGKPLIYKVKRDKKATKRQKEHLQDLAKYHRIELTVQIDSLSGNEISRLTDKIIAQYGRI